MKIGTVEIPGVVALAPMAGVTDFAFRRLCRSCGAALTTTEMVSARALAYNDGRSRELLYMPDDEAPAAVQIFGHEPDIMALAGKIIEAVCRCVTVPVTVKFRKGWDNGSANAVEFAKICEQAGASALTVHGRTRAQMYSGHADREIIREVKKAVSVPVTANGDIFSGKDAAKMMQYTGCDMVMIGRGCFGDPWLFARANAALRGEDEPALPPLQDRMDAAVRQIEDLAVQRGERAACLEARHQLPWYLHGVAYSGVYRQQMVHVETLDEIRRIASQVKRDLR